MATQQLIMGIVKFLHDLFTVIWVGGLAFLVLTLMPSLKKMPKQNLEAQNLMTAITRTHRTWVYICIAGLLITGLLLGKPNPNFAGLMNFSNLYSTLVAIKHILTIAMIVIALFRSIRFGKKDVVLNPTQFKFGMSLIVINFILGISVLLLSGLIAVI